MLRKKPILLLIYIAVAIVLGFLPLFFPISISNYKHINWGGQDLSANLSGDPDYLDEIFPEFNEPSHLYVYSLLGKTKAEKYAMITLQGLVNKENIPNRRLFCQEMSEDAFWLEQLEEYFGVATTNISAWRYLEDVVYEFRDFIKGFIIYDENLIDTVNVATFLASLNECVVITGGMYNNFKNTTGIDKVFYDLRGNFTNKVDLYTWAWDNYKHEASKTMLCNLDTNRARFRDMIIASKAFTFWLTAGPFGDPAEVALFRRIMAETPVNIPMFGWEPEGAPGEYETVRTLSEFGKYIVPCSISNPTVYSAFKIEEFQQKQVDFNVNDFEIKNKIYLGFIVSDGDNVNYCQTTLKRLWGDENRGNIPIGITLSPLLYKINPIVLEYYYDSATENDYFVCPPSGGGYGYPDLNPSFAAYLNQSVSVSQKCDMDQIWLLNGYEPFEPTFSPEVINAYAANYSAVYLNYHDMQSQNSYLHGEVPVFYSNFVEQENEVMGKLLSLQVAQPKEPLFIWIAYNSWNIDFTSRKNMVDSLDPNVYEVLRPDQFAEVFKQYYESKPTYEIGPYLSLLLGGVVPLITSAALLCLVGLKSRKKFNLRLDDSEKASIGEFSEIKIYLKIFYVLLDVAFIFVLKYLLFSTNLLTLFLALFLVSVILGIFLKPLLEKYIGTVESVITNIIILSAGFVLFALDYRFIMILGVAVGFLLSLQFQSQELVYHSPHLKKRSLTYSLFFAVAVVSIFPWQTFDVLIWFIIGGLVIISASIIPQLSLQRHDNKIKNLFVGNYLEAQKYPYFKSFPVGFLLVFLVFLIISSERFFWHLIWGIEFYPSKLLIGIAISSILITTVLIFELLHLKSIKIPNKVSYIVGVVGIACYLLVPFLLQGPIFFYLIHLIYLIGLFLLLDKMIENFPSPIDDKIVENKGVIFSRTSNLKNSSIFIFGVVFYFVFILILSFIPPVTIVVDTYNLMEKAGIVGITDLDWPALMWMFFYLPQFYTILALPITLFVLIFGLCVTIIIG